MQTQQNRLSLFPIMLYGSTMGIGGLTLAYKKLSLVFGLPGFVFYLLSIFTTAIFVLISIFYMLKIIKFKDDVISELNHPIKINFFAMFSISTLLLSSILTDYGYISKVLFYVATTFQTLLTFYVINFWMNRELSISQVNPVWFLPIVGNLIIVITSNEINDFLWYSFSLSLLFWIALFTIVFYRLVLSEMLPDRLMPTLFIFIAPPAVSFLCYIKLTGSFDTFAQILLNLTIFFVALMLFLCKNFIKLKFSLSWWAFTFPVASASMAFLTAYEIGRGSIYAYFGVGTFLFLSSIVLINFILTLKLIKSGEMFKPE